MMKFLKIMKEEFHHFLHDPGVLLIMVIGVFAYSLIYTIPYAREVVTEVPIGVVDLDNSTLSRLFVKNLNKTSYVDVVSHYVSMPEAEKEFYNSKIKSFIVIPNDFQRNILKGRQANISFYADTSYLIIYKSVNIGVVQTAITMGAKIEVAKLMKAGIPKQIAMTVKQPFEFVQIPLYNAAGGYKTYVYPVVLILILHQTLIVGIGLMQGTRHELKDEYCKKEDNLPLMIFARSSMYVFLYLAYSLIFFLLYPALFVYPMDYNIIPLFLLLTAMYYAAAFFSHTLSYFFKTRESALMLMVVTSLIFVFIPGLIWPREAMPMCVNIFSFFIPATCAIDGIIKVDQMGATFWDIKWDLLWLIFLCGLYFVTSNFMITKRNEEIRSKNK